MLTFRELVGIIIFDLWELVEILGFQRREFQHWFVKVLRLLGAGLEAMRDRGWWKEDCSETPELCFEQIILDENLWFRLNQVDQPYLQISNFWEPIRHQEKIKFDQVASAKCLGTERRRYAAKSKILVSKGRDLSELNALLFVRDSREEKAIFFLLERLGWRRWPGSLRCRGRIRCRLGSERLKPSKYSEKLPIVPPKKSWEYFCKANKPRKGLIFLWSTKSQIPSDLSVRATASLCSNHPKIEIPESQKDYSGVSWKHKFGSQWRGLGIISKFSVSTRQLASFFASFDANMGILGG